MKTLTLADLTDPPPPEGPMDWNSDGVLILPGFLDSADIFAYCHEWVVAHGPGRWDDGWWWDGLTGRGWDYATPYMDHPALRALCCDQRLATVLEGLLGTPAGVHLNLSGWVTTTRDWHQDGYLNPPHVGDDYAAVWMALDDIDSRSGPFQYVPGSHRWPQVTQAKIGTMVDLTDPLWPTHSEDFLTPLFTKEIAYRGIAPVTYLPKRGDVLIWHSRLLHRGTKAQLPGLERRALISHFSGIYARKDMPAAVQHEREGWFFPLNGRQPTR